MPNPVTNFKDSSGVDLGQKLITKDYLISVYPSIGQQIGIPPELWVWGSGSTGQLGTNDTTNRSTPVTTFAGGTNWKQSSHATQSNNFSAAIKTDGTLWTWGSGSFGQLGTNDTTNRSTPATTFAGGTDWKQVYVCNGFAAAIKTDGTLWTWGNNSNGQLGTNDITPNRSTPVTTFAGGTDWKQVGGGRFYTAAIKTDGTLWTWGRGSYGQLGNNDTLNVSTPVTTFAGGTDWKQIGVGSNHVAAIKTDGTLWTWGSVGSGRLGTNDITPNRSTPVTTFAGGTNWKQVSAGSHTAAIKTDGTLWTWGPFTSGELGRFSPGFVKLTPITTFAGGTNWADTATGAPEELYTLIGGGSSGNCHSGAIKTDGTLWVWGANTSGELGTNDITPTRYTPVTTFAGGTNWKQVSGGVNYTAAIKTDGTLWTWGVNSSGQLGVNDTTPNRSTPVTTFSGGTDWKQVSAGVNHVAAIKTDGTLWTWGTNNFGQLGVDDTTPNRSTPVTTFAGGTDWKQVSAGSQYTAAIKTDGTLWVWGYNNSGRLGTNDITPNRSTPVTTFAGGTNWKQVVATFSSAQAYTVAIKTDGTLWIWGAAISGRLGTNDITPNRSTPVTTFAGGTNWKQVSAGSQYTAAIKTDGTLWTWGSAFAAPLGTNDLIDRSTPVTTFAGGTNWTQVGTGYRTPIALKTDGTLWTWGNGAVGQLGENFQFDTNVPNQTYQQTTDWKQVSAGEAHTAAVKTDGTLWTWGNAINGRLGTNDTTPNRSTPVTTFAGGTNWKQVSAGEQCTLAVKSVDF